MKSTDALTRETNFVYDGLGRQTTVTAPLSNVRTTVYSPTNGLVTSRTDAKGVSTSYGYDLLSRVLTTTDRTGKLTTNTYNTAGQLASITDAQAKVTTYIYNLLGQRTSTTLPDNTAKAMTYDPAGRLKKTTSASGKSQTNVYEFSGVLDKIEFRNAANTLVGTDDYTYDALLRKTGSTGRYSVTQAWAYNDLGQLATDTTTYSGQSYAVNFAYDTRGRMNQITYPSGRVAAYTFTDRSELDKINWAGSQIEDRAYDAVGLLTGVDRPGVDETRAYDALNRVTSIGNTNVGDGTYTYDANSNKLSESWSGAMAAWNFITTNAGANPQGYDAEDRFTNFIQSGQSKTLGLTRSDIGNISNINLNGTNTARGYSNIHALTSIGSTNQVFDTDGNLTNAQTGIDLAWDEAGMMKESIVGTGDTAGIVGTNTYGYDADRKRVWKKRMLESSTNEHTVFIHAGPNVIAEYPAGTAAASPTQEYVYGQEIDSLVLLVRTGGTEKLTITRNQQWSVTALSDAASGSVLERYTYDHFGKRTILEPNGSTVRNTSSYNMSFGYTSRQHDAETGLLFMRARYYDHLTGEFVSPDPLEYVDGMSLFRGYFVPDGLDPFGLTTFCHDRCKPHSYDANGNWIWNQSAYFSCMQACEKKFPPPTYPPQVDPETGIIEPYFPNDGGTNVNIWGNDEADGFTDYQTAGCPDPDVSPTNPDPRPSTANLPDNSVDQIFIRSSPFRCECEMKEICRICRDGCVVTVSVPQISEDDLWPLGAPAPFFQTRDEMLRQLKACLADRLKESDIIKQYRDDGTSMTSLVFRLDAGDCGKCPNEK